MRVVSFLMLLTAVTSTAGQNAALFWNLYEAVVRGGRILHDVTEGVGAVSKAIHAIDSFLDSTAQEQILENLKKSEIADDGELLEDGSLTEDQSDGTQKEKEKAVLEDQKVGVETEPPISTAFTGCGALGFHIRHENVPMELLTRCCGLHDACYSSSCGVNKRMCDYKLKTCLTTVCEDPSSVDRAQVKTCRGAAKLLFSGTMALSYQQFSDAQNKLSCKRQGKSYKGHNKN